MNKEQLDKLRIGLSVESKNGIDFTLAAAIIWGLIAWIWALDYGAYDRSVLVFIAAGPMLPLAFAFSKLFGTNWKIKDNPLQPLGMWLNLAQVFYFPFLVFILVRMPEYFPMGFAIITGAHFLPYAWFYKTIWYAVFAVLIPLGSLLLGLWLDPGRFSLIALFTSVCLLTLSAGLILDYNRKKGKQFQ